MLFAAGMRGSDLLEAYVLAGSRNFANYLPLDLELTKCSAIKNVDCMNYSSLMLMLPQRSQSKVGDARCTDVLIFVWLLGCAVGSVLGGQPTARNI